MKFEKYCHQCIFFDYGDCDFASECVDGDCFQHKYEGDCQ